LCDNEDVGFLCWKSRPGVPLSLSLLPDVLYTHSSTLRFHNRLSIYDHTLTLTLFVCQHRHLACCRRSVCIEPWRSETATTTGHYATAFLNTDRKEMWLGFTLGAPGLPKLRSLEGCHVVTCVGRLSKFRFWAIDENFLFSVAPTYFNHSVAQPLHPIDSSLSHYTTSDFTINLSMAASASQRNQVVLNVTNTFRFLDLPLEIREMIYYEYLALVVKKPPRNPTYSKPKIDFPITWLYRKHVGKTYIIKGAHKIFPALCMTSS
jgi:hypothetical protein